MCVLDCDTAINEERLHGRTVKNRCTAVQEKKLARPYRKKADTARKEGYTTVHTLCTLVEFCTAAHSGMYTDPSAYRQGILNPYYLRTHHTRLHVFQRDQHLDVRKTTKTNLT